jgi:N-acetylneuraminate lyase
VLKLTGIMSALLTPFDGEGDVNQTAIRDIVEFQLAAGLSGFYVCGSTGEGLLLTEAERQLVTETVIDQVQGRVPVVVHVGAITTDAARTLAAHAERAGADAISSVPPFYYSVGNEGVTQHYARIAEASSLPFYVYNLPGATGVNVGVSLMHDLMASVPTLHGIKYTAYNFYEMRQLIELEDGRLNVISGPDEMMIAAQAMGAHGAIGSSYNYLPRLFTEAYEAFNAGDVVRARELQAKGNWIVRIFLQFPSLSAIKEIMRLIGFDCGSARSPLLPLTDEQKGQLREMLEEVGFFGFAETGAA